MSDKSNRKQRLMSRHRLTLFNFACEVFKNAELRAAEDQAKEDLIRAVRQDIADIPQHEMETLTRYGLVRETTNIRIQCCPKIPDGTKTFVLPNGNEVDRPRVKTMSWVKDTFSVADMQELRSFGAGKGNTVCALGFPNIPFEAKAPLYERRGAWHTADIVIDERGDNEEGSLFARDSLAAVWMTKRSYSGLQAYAKAHHDRYQGELAILEPMAKVLLAAERFGDVLDIWPEAEQRANDLFGPAPVNNALVAISNEDKVAICNALSRRGVTSPVCGAMVSPAYAVAAA